MKKLPARGLYARMMQTLAEGAQVDPSVQLLADVPTAARESIGGGGAPAKWLVSQERFAQLKADHDQQAAAAASAQQVAHGADVATRVAGAAKSAGDAAQSLQGAGLS